MKKREKKRENVVFRVFGESLCGAKLTFTVFLGMISHFFLSLSFRIPGSICINIEFIVVGDTQGGVAEAQICGRKYEFGRDRRI